MFFIRAPDTTQLTVCFTMTPCGMTINDMVCLTVVSCSLLTIPVLLHIRVGSSVVVLFKLVITCIRSALACTSEVMACLWTLFSRLTMVACTSKVVACMWTLCTSLTLVACTSKVADCLWTHCTGLNMVA